jgi:serine/threonine-protein kinase
VTTVSDTQSNDPLIGTLLGGRYRILEKLGEGAMGAVYVAEHVRIGRRDAIKLLRGELSQDSEAIARFSRGARIVSAIRHPNVCSIYDFGDTDDGYQFLAMEYVAGGTLREMLEREGRLPIERAVRIARQTAGALQAAHDSGIVHRDLKPANIMLATTRDGLDEVKVVDFDIAKIADGGGEEVTRLGFVVGTPEYMSPEQLMGERLDGRSDVYSLGLVLFRMLTGALPFRANAVQEVMVERLTHSPLTLAEVLPGTPFPEGLQDIISHALERRLAERCASAADFEQRLTALSGTHAPAPVSGPPAATRPSNRADAAPTSPVPELPPTRVVAGKDVPNAPAGAPARFAGKRRTAQFALGGVLLVTAVVAGIALLQNGGGAPNVDPGAAGSALNDSAPQPERVVAVDSQKRPNNTTPRQGSSRSATDPGSTVSPPLQTNPPPAGATGEPGTIVIPPAQARNVLDEQLFRLDPDQPPGDVALQATLDTATSIWRMGELAVTDRALAAYVIGSAYDLRRDWTRCVTWLDSAIALNAGGRGYVELRTKCQSMRD